VTDPKQPSPDLRRRALRGTLLFAVALWLLIFVPAGALNYGQGWLLWAHFTAWTLGGTLYFLRRDPALVERRLRAGPAAETEPAQKRIQLFASIAICALFVMSALDYRLGWSAVPAGAVLVGHALVAVGYLCMFAVFRANSFAASTVAVASGQRVVSTGPYARVRHPMYSGALVMFAGIPLALGSWWGLLPVIALAAALVLRLNDEEKYLVRHLPGYQAYRDAVRWRLLPGIW
jgi:protein-S-isoprenylcysteine O-methyltransferase Ste14